MQPLVLQPVTMTVSTRCGDQHREQIGGEERRSARLFDERLIRLPVELRGELHPRAASEHLPGMRKLAADHLTGFFRRSVRHRCEVDWNPLLACDRQQFEDRSHHTAEIGPELLARAGPCPGHVDHQQGGPAAPSDPAAESGGIVLAAKRGVAQTVLHGSDLPLAQDGTEVLHIGGDGGRATRGADAGPQFPGCQYMAGPRSGYSHARISRSLDRAHRPC